jgi:DoxX-like protein
MKYALWTIQALLALLFAFGGAAKLAMPLDELAAQTGIPGPLLLVVSVSELLGALGLILPGLLRIKPGLTPLAAAGLVIIMIGATTLTLTSGQGAAALFPALVGLLAAFVAYGRMYLAPQQPRTPRTTLQAAAARA